MNQDLAVTFPVPVVLALLAMLMLMSVVMPVVMRIVLALRQPVTVRAPGGGEASVGAGDQV